MSTLFRSAQGDFQVEVNRAPDGLRVVIGGTDFPWPVEFLPDGAIQRKNAACVERPDDINRLLVNAGVPPTHLVVEEEELEQYFLRLVGMDGGLPNE